MADSSSFRGGDSHAEETCGRSSRQSTFRKTRFNDMTSNTMTHLIVDLVRVRKIDRLCLSHCYIGSSGVKALQERITTSNIRYLNISWCGLTGDSVEALCSFYRFSHNLEKILM